MIPRHIVSVDSTICHKLGLVRRKSTEHLVNNVLLQGEAQFGRLLRDMTNAKNSVKVLQEVFQGARDKERCPVHTADSILLEHQMQLQNAFVEQSGKLKANYDERKQAESEIARRYS